MIILEEYADIILPCILPNHWYLSIIIHGVTFQGPLIYRGADKSLARPDWKKQLKGRHFLSDAEVIAAAETWLDGQTSDFFLSGLQKLEFSRCSFFLPGRAKDLSAHR